MNEVGGVQITAPNMRGTAQLVAGGMNWATSVFWHRQWLVPRRATEIVEHGRAVRAGRDHARRAGDPDRPDAARNLYGGIDPVGQELRVTTYRSASSA